MGSTNVTVWKSERATRAVVLVLHGGAEHGQRPVRPWRLAYLRMVPLVRAAHRAGAGMEVRLLRNRVRGWNEPARDPVADARLALDAIRQRHPDTPVLLIGHSMGGRVALRVADDPQVTAVCALAPWTPKAEPVEPVSGRVVVLAHGERDRITSRGHSHAYAERAVEVATRLVRFEVAREQHAMLRRPGLWSSMVRAFALENTGSSSAWEPLARAWRTPLPERLRVHV